MNVASLIANALGADDLPVGVTAYDGSRAGPVDAPATMVIHSKTALARIARAPGELGFARAYVAGELDIEGDLFAAMHGLFDRVTNGIPHSAALRFVKGVGLTALKPVPPPPEESRPHGRRHGKARDAEAISHHYDVGNDFYEVILGPAMTYSCAVWETPDVGLEAAQAAKCELVCRKLALRPGMRLLDIGCGWGSLVRHAARFHGVQAVGITISAEQAAWARERVMAEGLGDNIEIRLQDYRDINDGPYDAVSSIGMFEHVGIEGLAPYVQICHDLVRPGGRVLNHGITRPEPSQPISPRSFVGRYVFPDSALPELGNLISVSHQAGLEVRHAEALREHYGLTLRAWVANLERNWDECVRMVGEGRARVWRLYMAASAVNFERGLINIHQVLGVRREEGQRLPLRTDWERVPLSRPGEAPHESGRQAH